MKKIIPVFYAADENYLPYLGVSLASIKKYATKENEYRIYILYTGDLGENAEKVKGMQTDSVRVEFIDVSEKAGQINGVMRCRDYYTSAIYFRLFIPDLFPEIDKAVYIDCDTVLLDDIAKLYQTDIGENYIGAVADQAVASVEAFCLYTKNALDIPAEKYFNSGVIVLNLKKLRTLKFFQTFYSILSSYDFIVAPDQDCLNLICKDNVYYLDLEWNTMPIAGSYVHPPKLVHYNLSMKPWHYKGMEYEEYFWDFAAQTPFYGEIIKALECFTTEQKQRDTEDGERLIRLAISEAENPNNYIRKLRQKTKNEVGRYGFIQNIT
jgi:lipopolysaccharide biosynthesis glycosyltransferase